MKAVEGASEDGGKVEAEAVDAGMHDEMAQAVDDQAPDEEVVAGKGISGSRCR